jgi:hypothetical protein
MSSQWRDFLRGVFLILVLIPGLACATESEYYRNSSGNEVHRPERAPRRPAGATARCRDGEYSFSQHHRGTCSGHGGVAQWYR